MIDHQRRATLAEWSSVIIPGASIAPADRPLVEQLAQGEPGRLDVEEVRTGVRVSATSWVGVVRLQDLEIRVVPKLAGEQLGLVRLLEFTTGLRAMQKLAGLAAVDTSGANLLDLIALLLAEASDAVARRGLIGDYVEREDELPAIRGRLLANRQVLERFGLVDRVICRFDEHEQDIPENRLIAAALGECLRRVSEPNVKRRVHRQFGIYRAVADPSALDLEVARRGVEYHRLNEHYREAHQLAWLVLDGLGVGDLLASGGTRSFTFLLDMNGLFERFVESAVRWVLRDDPVRVQAQVVHRSILWHAEHRRPYARVIPDLLVSGTGDMDQRLVIDAKYKLYDERKIASSDLYQMFLYAYAFGRGDLEVLPRAMLLYPASAQARTLRVQVRRDSHPHAEITATGLPLAAALEEIGGGTRGPVLSALRAAILRNCVPASAMTLPVQ